jgi:phage terminase large subunit-like protein
MVFHPKPRLYKWVSVLEDELKEFDKGEHDDIVDTVSYAGILVYGKRRKAKVLKITCL